MIEVIELLSSSSPPTSPPGTKAAVSSIPSKALLPENLGFDINDFEDTVSIDFQIYRPSKRQCRSPQPYSKSLRKTASPSNNSHPQVTFDILSDDEVLPHVETNPSGTVFRLPTENTVRVDEIDDIVFSSSAPEPRTTTQPRVDTKSKFPLDDLDDKFLNRVPFSLSQPTKPSQQDEGYSLATTNLLARINQESAKDEECKQRPSRSKVSQGRKIPTPKAKAPDDIDFSPSPTELPPKQSSKLSEPEKAAKTAERAAAKAIRDAEKEVDKARKRSERERKAQEKQKASDLAEANKSRVSKKDATPEMIVDMSSFLKNTSVGDQIEKYMKTVEVELNYIDEEINLVDNDQEPDQYGSIVMWRRKVKATYNDEDDQWEPMSGCRIVRERHVLIHLTAVDFAAVVAFSRSGAATTVSRTEAEMKCNLDAHVASIRRRFPDCAPIYLIEGLHSWLKKHVTAKNRAYAAAVRAQMVSMDAENGFNIETSASQARSRKRKKPAADSVDLSFVTADLIDDLLLHLQLAHQPISIHHTATPGCTASQIAAFTQHLATRPYRLAQLDYNLKSASFCMDKGQVRTGDDAKDAFVKMLQEVTRVTPSMAYGIVEECQTVRQLVKGFEREGNLLLQDVRKRVNKDGGWSDKRLGPQVSKRLFKVFMGRDPAATDGMS